MTATTFSATTVLLAAAELLCGAQTASSPTNLLLLYPAASIWTCFPTPGITSAGSREVFNYVLHSCEHFSTLLLHNSTSRHPVRRLQPFQYLAHLLYFKLIQHRSCTNLRRFLFRSDTNFKLSHATNHILCWSSDCKFGPQLSTRYHQLPSFQLVRHHSQSLRLQ